jgi:hypothetical protein
METMNDELRRHILDAAIDWGRENLDPATQILSMRLGSGGIHPVTLIVPRLGSQPFTVNVVMDPNDPYRVERVEPVE